MQQPYPASVYAAAQVKYLADYPRLPFGNRMVPDFSEYLAREYAAWYDSNFMYAMGVQI